MYVTTSGQTFDLVCTFGFGFFSLMCGALYCQRYSIETDMTTAENMCTA